jgi:hypothetical protein
MRCCVVLFLAGPDEWPTEVEEKEEDGDTGGGGEAAAAAARL